MSTGTVTSTATAVSATPTSCGGSLLYDIPARDASCAMPFGGNHTDIMSQCCKSTDVVSYYSDCGLYCLAVDQTIDDLTKCLYSNGAAYQDVFCNGAGNATATATDYTLPATASASVVSGADDNGDDNDDNNDDDNDGSAASSTSSPDAAAGLRPDYGVTKVGLTIGALLISATAFGAFQL
ncbi:hypothetical protein F5X99DRAFT_382542 [Biscogniauxia marginata]|nr:hypothetical protein F5X99DRAFT_382542 [Biscogniauxia marginata]